MHALIVLAHPEPESFTAALAHTAADALRTAGWTVELADLAAEGFRPDAGRHDLTHPPEGPLQLMAAQEQATATGGYAPDVAREIGRLQQCDLLLTVFPFWWFSPPALLKGWFDRVFANGIAYGHDPYDEGPLKGKRALAVVAIGGDEAMYGEAGRAGSIEALLNPLLHGTFRYCAFDVLKPFLVFEADGPENAVRESALRELSARLTSVAGESPIETRPLRQQ